MNEERKIIDCIRRLGRRAHELVSGTVVPGSVDITTYTCQVHLSHMQPGDAPLSNVMLSAVSENGNGTISIPADGSNVIVGSMDGPGEYFIVQCSNLAKQITTIGNTVLTITPAGYNVVCGSESLTKILTDLLTAISNLTVETPSGNSSVPVNLTDFNDIKTRLSNLLIQ
ncbi:MAG: hypothetical protein P4L41_16355 [Flavipsychrobacter sp.]|nr:hypothetical protein [Flavipsychrobacter sp.]